MRGTLDPRGDVVDPRFSIVIEPEDEHARAALLAEIDELIAEGLLREVRADSADIPGTSPDADGVIEGECAA